MSLTVETFATLNEAAAALRTDGTYIGGGTMVMAASNFADPDLTRVVRSLDREMTTIRPEGGGLRIGAGVTMTQLVQDRETAFLEPVARSVGGPAVRNMATVGGNLYVKPPFGDLSVGLLALGASVHMSHGQSMSMDDFLAQRETLQGLVATVSVPRPAPGAFRYRKVTRTRPKGAAVLTIAAHLPGSARISGARIAFGVMGPAPARARGAEAALEGAPLDRTSVERACAACIDGLAPQDDALASAWYRRTVAPVHLRRVLLNEEV